MMRALVGLAVATTAYGHASVIMPPSRNAIDGEPGTPWSVPTFGRSPRLLRAAASEPGPAPRCPQRSILLSSVSASLQRCLTVFVSLAQVGWQAPTDRLAYAVRRSMHKWHRCVQQWPECILVQSGARLSSRPPWFHI